MAVLKVYIQSLTQIDACSIMLSLRASFIVVVLEYM